LHQANVDSFPRWRGKVGMGANREWSVVFAL
jgi:hypothetical protein